MKGHREDVIQAVKDAYLEGYSYVEITQLTGVPRGSIHRLVQDLPRRHNLGGKVAKTIPKVPVTQKTEYISTVEGMQELINKRNQRPGVSIPYEVTLQMGGYDVAIHPTAIVLSHGFEVLTVERSKFNDLVQTLLQADKIAETLNGGTC